MLPAGTKDYASYELQPDTVYYLLPGTHVGSIQADAGDSFVGGLAGGQATILSGNYSQSEGWAIDSNWTNGNQPGVTIEYLTIEKYTPGQNAAAINQDTNTGWTLKYNTVTLNVPGAGILAGADNTIEDNCLTLNGQYGFQAFLVNTWGRDSLTGGPYDITAADNEISYNDTCDYSGLLDNSAIGWKNYNPVPAQYQNPQCGQVTPDGDQGGFKLWRTDGVTVKDNYIHNNWGPGAWNDTGNANTTIAGNTITDNEGQAIVEEISYNFSITGNYMAGNDITDGLANAGFPQPAVYISNAAVTPRSAPCQPARKRRARVRAPTPISRSSPTTPWWTTAATFSSGRTPTGSARTPGRHVHAGRRRAIGAVHDAVLRREPAVGHHQHQRLRRQQDRLARRGLVGRLPVGDRQRQRHRQRDRLQPG